MPKAGLIVLIGLHNMIPTFDKAHVNQNMGRKLQCINTIDRRDHYPIHGEFNAEPAMHTKNNKHRWDRDFIMTAVAGHL